MILGYNGSIWKLAIACIIGYACMRSAAISAAKQIYELNSSKSGIFDLATVNRINIRELWEMCKRGKSSSFLNNKGLKLDRIWYDCFLTMRCRPFLDCSIWSPNVDCAWWGWISGGKERRDLYRRLQKVQDLIYDSTASLAVKSNKSFTSQSCTIYRQALVWVCENASFQARIYAETRRHVQQYVWFSS